MTRRLVLVALAALVAVAIVRSAVRPTFIGGFRQIDDYNIALQVLGASPTWRSITELTETASEVTLGVSEIGMLQLGAGFGDERIGYVLVSLGDPLGNRQVIDAATGAAILRIAP
jgi:hypothetical protein